MTKNFKEVKLAEGFFAGKTAVFETESTAVIVGCPDCGWEGWQTFYVKHFTASDIGRVCPSCGGKLQFKGGFIKI